ncbi:MAG: PqqD family protein [Mariprofundaceae bacterium]
MALPEHPEKIEDLSGEDLEGLDEVVYVREEDGACFSLNITASAVLELCNGKRRRSEIADEINSTLQTESHQTVVDVDTIITQFVDYGLVYAEDSDGD